MTAGARRRRRRGAPVDAGLTAAEPPAPHPRRAVAAAGARPIAGPHARDAPCIDA